VSRPILVVSSSFDADTHRPVCERLVARGKDVVVYETDQVMSGLQLLSLSIDNGSPNICCNGKDISPGNVSAAWMWKVASFRNADAEKNVSKQLSMVNEMSLWNRNLWSLYPDEVWINSPGNTYSADRKLMQLVTARKIGFNIPETLVSSSWRPVRQMLTNSDSNQIVVKMMRGAIADQNQIRVLYTTILDREAVDSLEDIANPFPGIYQIFVPKAREWRVTVVGEECFPVAIYTGSDSRDDWRRHQLKPSVQFRREDLPDDITQKCISYLKEFSLKYGAFDLVERPDGQIFFLECNPSGQHNWLEEAVGIPVSDAIAGMLLRIASEAS
jgi:hypothetical protein